MENNSTFFRLRNLEANNSEITDKLLSDDYVAKNTDYLMQNRLIGNVRRYADEIEGARIDDQLDEFGEEFLLKINNIRSKKVLEECKKKSNSFGCKNVNSLEYITSIRDSIDAIKIENLSLKDFLQFRKENSKTSMQDETLVDFKLKIAKSEFNLFEKRQINVSNNEANNKNYNVFNFNKQPNDFMANLPKEDNSSKNILYMSNSLNNNNQEPRSQETKTTFIPPNRNVPDAKITAPVPTTTLKYEPRRCNKRRNEEDQINKEDYENVDLSTLPFKSAREQLLIDNEKKHQNSEPSNQYSMAKRPMISNNQVSNNPASNNQPVKRGIHSKFNLPIRSNDEQNNKQNNNNNNNNNGNMQAAEIASLKNIDQKLIEIIMSEMMDRTAPVTWNHICGLEFQKETIQEIVIWPMMRPDIFKGLRGPPKGLLLFGPPGTGKTLFAKCIAHESQSTFFNISASTLTSKWQGESEKLVKVLYEVARAHQPAVIFIDEIDSLLSKRSDDDRESSRRLKTEFFVQMDGARTMSDERILTIGATNRPQELDDAARRRFVKKLFIPLPEKSGRKQIIVNLMDTMGGCDMAEDEIDELAQLTDGYSGADMSNLCQEASLGPIRYLKSKGMCSISSLSADQVRAINYEDFINAMQQVKASVSQSDLESYFEWNKSFGSTAI